VMIWLHGLDRGERPDYSHRYRAGWFWWRDRPHQTEIETALRKACAISSRAAEIWGPVLENLEQQRQHPRPPEQLIEDLRHGDWVERFTAAQLLVTLGGAAVPHLQAIAAERASILRRKAIDLLRRIEQETTTQLADRCLNLLCPRCLRRCGQHSVRVADEMTITYYGCRMCGQSHVLWPGKVVAVLDADMPSNVERTDPIRVNWLTRHFLFDFDEVEIIRATDEEVERFVVQVGNDTDPARKGRYRHMPCRIGPECHLSENTIRVLGNVFEMVVQA
jgi:RNase P subunit RPR2